MTTTTWSPREAEAMRSHEPPADMLPGETFRAITDVEDYEAAVGENREFAHTRIGGRDE